MLLRSLLLSSSIVLLIGCGGGSSPDNPPNNPPEEEPVDPIIDDNGKTKIGLLAVYSDSAENAYGDPEARIVHLTAVTNRVLDDSQADLFIELKDIQKITIDETASAIQILDGASSNNELSDLRALVGGDIVTIYAGYKNDGLCGLAYVNTSLTPDYSYNYTAIDCNEEAATHELGHNLGLAHSHAQDLPEDGIFPFSFGHGVDNSFVTIMAYTSAYNTNSMYTVFSNPELSCGGEPCGIDIGYENEAYAAESIRRVKDEIALFY